MMSECTRPDCVNGWIEVVKHTNYRRPKARFRDGQFEGGFKWSFDRRDDEHYETVRAEVPTVEPCPECKPDWTHPRERKAKPTAEQAERRVARKTKTQDFADDDIPPVRAALPYADE